MNNCYSVFDFVTMASLKNGLIYLIISWLMFLNGNIFSSAECDYIETKSSQGSINFPDSSRGEGISSYCKWTFDIESPGGQYLYLDIRDIYLDDFDTLEIFDGFVSRTWHGKPDNFMLIGSIDETVITINTTSDLDGRNVGILYSTTTCSAAYQSASGVISAPIYSPQNGNFYCTWTITANWGNQVLLSFNDYQSGTIVIENSGTRNSYNELPPDTISTNKDLIITVTASMVQDSEVFKAAFIFVDDSCSGRVPISDSKAIQLSSTGAITRYCVLLLQAVDSTMTVLGTINTENTVSGTNAWATTTINDGGRFGKNILYHSSLSGQGANFQTTGNTAWIQFVQNGEGVVLDILANADFKSSHNVWTNKDHMQCENGNLCSDI